jgi:hypothetical protein
MRRKLRMLAVKVMMLGIMTLEVMGTVKTVRPTGETG